MNLLALVSDAFGGTGGIAQYNRDLLSAMVRCRRTARVVVLARGGRSDPALLPPGVSQIEPGGKLRFVASALHAALLKGPFDVIFCGHLNLVRLGAALARLLQVPLWLQLHGSEAWQHLPTPQRRAAERASLVSSVSRYTRHRFLANTTVAPWRVRVLPNTVRADFAPGPKPQDLVEMHGLRGRKVLLTVGRLAAAERGKGHDRMIEALPELLPSMPELIYLVVGDGDDRPRLEALASDLGVARHVVFAGAVDDRKLPDYYRVADIFVMPSVQEGFGIVFLEAAASGLKVIGGNDDGTRDALGDGTFGRLIDPWDRRQLVGAIGAAAQDPAPDLAPLERYAWTAFSQQVCGLMAEIDELRGQAGKRAFLQSVAPAQACCCRPAAPAE